MLEAPASKIVPSTQPGVKGELETFVGSYNRQLLGTEWKQISQKTHRPQFARKKNRQIIAEINAPCGLGGSIRT